MIFWILIGLVILGSIIFTISEAWDALSVFTCALGSLFIGNIIAGLIFVVGFWWVPAEVNQVSDETYALSSLGTDSDIAGRS